MEPKTFILSLLMCFAMIASVAVSAQSSSNCTVVNSEGGGTTIVCEDGTVVILSEMQPNGGCADAFTDCAAVIHLF